MPLWMQNHWHWKGDILSFLGFLIFALRQRETPPSVGCKHEKWPKITKDKIKKNYVKKIENKFLSCSAEIPTLKVYKKLYVSPQQFFRIVHRKSALEVIYIEDVYCINIKKK